MTTTGPVPYDVEAVRAEFPVLAREHHPGTSLVYLDNAATTQKPRAVIDSLDRYYSSYNANVHRGIHLLSEEATAAYEDARMKVKAFLHARSRREVIFTRGTTESLNLVAQSWGRANLGPGDVVLSTVMEHHSNIVPWQILAAEIGFTLRFLSITPEGLLDLDEYQRILATERVRVVTVMAVSNVLGTVNPIAEMTQLAHEHGALILVDAAQAVPHMPMDVQTLDVDFLAFSGHKMAGPTGIGVLYGKRALLETMPPWMGGGDMISRVTLSGSEWNELPYKFEAGTPSIAETIGLGAAVDYLTALGLDAIHAHEHVLTEYALDRLAEVPGVTVFGPDASRRGAVAAFTVQGIHAHDVAQMLDMVGVAVRAGHHCAMPLHTELNIPASARASFYLYNTTREIDVLIDGLYAAKRTFHT